MERLSKKVKITGKESLLHTVLSLGCMAVNGALGVVFLFNLRNALMTVVDRSSVRVFAINYIDISLSIFLSLCWLVFVFVSQHLYEKDFAKSLFPRRFIIITAVQLALLCLVFCYSRFALGI